MILISIITVNFHQPQATIAFLQSVNLHYTQANIEIILVDNGTKENNEQYFKRHRSDLVYIHSDQNLGFAGGNNLGIKQAKGDFLFLVNNDTEITSGLIETLCQTLVQNPHIGIISPKINYYDDKSVIQYAGYTPMNYYTCRNSCIGQYESDQKQYDNLVQPTGYVHGAAMMLTRAALLSAGPMAENYFLYYEETDWCEQIKKSGYQVWINTNALIYHKESISVGKNSALKEYFMNRNRILFIRRNARFSQRLLFYTYFLVFVTPRNMLKYLISGTPSYIPVLFRAIWWNIINNINSTKLGFSLR